MPTYNEKDLKQTVTVGLFWKFAERIGVQIVQFVIQMILARLLLPEDFGTIAIINVLILVATVLVQYGFCTALIQKKDVDDIDYSSVLFVNTFICIIMYLLIFTFAPLLGKFYNDSQLSLLLRVQGIILFFSAISGVQNAILTRKMDFKRSFLINCGAIFFQGIVGITLAFNRWGIWSLVVSQLVNSIMLVILGFIFINWRPSLTFSFSRVQSMFAFGKNLLLASLIETIFSNVYSLVIGKVYTQESLGYYNRGQSIPNMLMTTINGSIQGVLFPAFSTYQDNMLKIKNMMRKSIKISAYLIFPIMFGIIAVAPRLISVLLTDKWLPAVPFLCLSCIAFSFYPIHTANLQAISAVGRSDIYLKLEIAKKVLLIGVLIVSLNYNIYIVMFGSVACSFISTIINAWPNKKLFDYSIIEQFKDIFCSLVLASIMGILTYIVGEIINFSNIITLIIQILAGSFFYIILSYLFKVEELSYLIKSLNEIIEKSKEGK